jgi:hypothetical protein
VKTFVVRVWTPPEPVPDTREPLRGLVEHIGSGRSVPFGNEAELLAFLLESQSQVDLQTAGEVRT